MTDDPDAYMLARQKEICDLTNHYVGKIIPGHHVYQEFMDECPNPSAWMTARVVFNQNNLTRKRSLIELQLMVSNRFLVKDVHPRMRERLIVHEVAHLFDDLCGLVDTEYGDKYLCTNSHDSPMFLFIVERFGGWPHTTVSEYDLKRGE